MSIMKGSKLPGSKILKEGQSATFFLVNGNNIVGELLIAQLDLTAKASWFTVRTRRSISIINAAHIVSIVYEEKNN